MNNVCIATVSTALYAPLVALTQPTKEAYAARWDFTVEHCVTDVEHADVFWKRIEFVYDLLAKYRNVIFMDSDVFVANQKYDVRHYLFLEKFLISTDACGINTGTFIASNDTITRQFLWCVLTAGKRQFANHEWREQEAMRHFLSMPPYHNLARFMPQNFMNSYWLKGYDGTYPADFQGNYSPGDWLVHLAGMGNDKRIQLIPEILAETSKWP